MKEIDGIYENNTHIHGPPCELSLRRKRFRHFEEENNNNPIFEVCIAQHHKSLIMFTTCSDECNNIRVKVTLEAHPS